ncbi:MAG: glycosyltransferase family 2 protein, partial [Candidatus Omnitrophica bacterium]|nr:glycosyltransferase family 2 protein [Candidatus Omnitrophota bacterium]
NADQADVTGDRGRQGEAAERDKEARMEVSLYIPCFNTAETLPFCLEAALRQTVRPKDILVVDDGSTDETSQVASRYPVRVIRHPRNLGLSAARNTAFKDLDAEYIAAVDSDCIVQPQWLENLMKRFQGPAVAGAGGRLKETYAWSVFDVWRSRHMRQDWGDEVCAPDFLFGSNTVFRRSVITEADFYNENLGSNYEDVDMCRRLKSRGYSVVYDPAAEADHLRSDNLYSLLNTFWKWHVAYYEDQRYYSDMDRFVYKIQDNFGLANRFFSEDTGTRNHFLLYLDFLLAFHHTLRDLSFFISGGNRKPCDSGVADGWLSFLDLDLFFHLRKSAPGYSTLMPRSTAFLHNVLALQLVSGRALQEHFEKDFSQTVCRHLLFSVCGIDDEYLAGKVMRLSAADRPWEELCAADHPYLVKEFLHNSLRGLRLWLAQLKDRCAGIEDILTLSARAAGQVWRL